LFRPAGRRCVRHRRMIGACIPKFGNWF
jgi:hypothetical protein